MTNQKAADIVRQVQNGENVPRSTIYFVCGYFTAICSKHAENGNKTAEEAVRKVINYLKSKV